MMISLIVAMARDRAIGKDNQLLWHLSDDLRRFKALTSGHAVIMGRKTFESLPKGVLPNRRNIIVSRTVEHIPGGEIATSLEEALSLCREEDNIFIVGGGQIYEQGIAIAMDLHLTIVEAEYPEADTFFPHIKQDEWEEIEREVRPQDEKNEYTSTYYHLRRLQDKHAKA